MLCAVESRASQMENRYFGSMSGKGKSDGKNLAILGEEDIEGPRVR